MRKETRKQAEDEKGDSAERKMKPKIKQPDFQSLFFSHFGKTPRKVTYVIRGDSNQDHDIIFLRSLIHDARFKMPQAVLRGKNLTLLINRDCWELGFVKHKNNSELHTANSKLTISPVLSVSWLMLHGQNTEGNELWIAEMQLEKSTDGETRNLKISGHDWTCIIKLKDDNLKIQLADEEIPHLHP